MREGWSTRFLFAIALAVAGCSSAPSVGDPVLSQRTFDCDASIVTGGSVYDVGDSIDVTWDCTPGNWLDWVVIAPQGASCFEATFHSQIYTTGNISGMHTFLGQYGVGNWVARVYENNTCTLLAESDPFEVDPGTPTVTVNASSYGASDSVVVTWNEMPGYPWDHVAIAHEGSALSQIVQPYYTNGSVSGSATLPTTIIGNGTFVARAFQSYTTTLLAESSPFTVSGISFSISSNHTTYAFGAPIIATYNLNGAPANFIAISPAGSTSGTDEYLVRENVGQFGSHTFNNLLPLGAYVLRAYENDSTYLLAESAPFEVTGPGGPTVTPPEVAHLWANFPVSWTGLSAFQLADWIGIAPWGTSGTYSAYVSPDGRTSGLDYAYPGITTPGRYEARAFDSNGITSYLAATQEFVVADWSCSSGDLPLPDGLSCGTDGECFAGLCVSSGGGCGDGARNPAGIAREGCDDGYLADGDACSSTCAPTPLIVASRAGQSDVPSPQLPAVAEDGTGRLLFVWLAETTVTGEPTRNLVARRYTSAGVPLDASPITIEANVGVSQPVRPSVAGMATGWAVTWRSTAIEGGTMDPSQGGIALRIIDRNGAGRPPQLVNQTTRWDQLDPRVARLDTGLVIVWTDYSVDGSTPHLRMRLLDTSGTPTTSEDAVAADQSGQESGGFVIARGSATSPSSDWAVAWDAISTVGALPEVRMRRFDGAAALDPSDIHVSRAWGTGSSLAHTATGIYVAWTTRDLDPRGNIAVRLIPDASGGPTDDTDVDLISAADSTTAHYADELPAIAPFPLDGSDGYVVTFRTDGSPAGGRIHHSSGVELPPEASALAPLLVNRAFAFSTLPTERGLWIVWADSHATTATTAVIAYLLPWS